MKELNYPNFTGRNVPIAEIAAAMRKNQQFVRLGLQNGYLKFGIAVKTGTVKAKSIPTIVQIVRYTKRSDISAMREKRQMRCLMADNTYNTTGCSIAQNREKIKWLDSTGKINEPAFCQYFTRNRDL